MILKRYDIDDLCKNHYTLQYLQIRDFLSCSEQREDRVQSPDQDCVRGWAGGRHRRSRAADLLLREFGFVTRALRIPNKDGPKEKFGFVDFDDYDAVDMVIQERAHYVCGHKDKV